MVLAIVGDSLAIAVDYDCSVVVLRSRWPFRCQVDFFGVANDDGAVVAECNCASP